MRNSSLTWSPQADPFCLLGRTVNLLAILANDAVAVPLCPTFPDSELRYVLNQSQALLLLASDKYQQKAEAVLKEGLDDLPLFHNVGKTLEGSKSTESISLETVEEGKSGMMLYTSGTTSRPVSPSLEKSGGGLLLTLSRKVYYFQDLF